jgi:hypothetical protein
VGNLFLILFLLLPITDLQPQRSTLYLCFQPNDKGLGFRYDYSFKKTGLYTSLTYGSYSFTGGHIKNHLKVSGGFILFNKRKTVNCNYNFLSSGISYNIYKGLQNSDLLNKQTLHPLAFELGAGTVIKRFSLAVRYEFIKKNASIDIGFRF